MKPTYEELENIVDNQARLIEVLSAKIEELTNEVEELRKQLNIYHGPNTPSSQKPNYTKKEKETKDQKKKVTEGKRGREKGHKGSTLTLEPTKIVDDHISECDHCHHEIPVNIQKKIYSYQEVETPVVIELDVIQHNVFEATCPNCNCVVNTDKENKGTIFGNRGDL